MKFKFGVMSSKYKMEAENLKVAKLAMTLFIGKQVPIAIYSQKESAFIPDMKFFEENFNYKTDKVGLAYKSIKKIK